MVASNSPVKKAKSPWEGNPTRLGNNGLVLLVTILFQKNFDLCIRRDCMWDESRDDAGKSVSFYKERKVLRKWLAAIGRLDIL